MTASIHFGIDGIVWSIICDGKLWIVLVTRLLNCWKLFYFIVFLMLSLFRHMPTRWNMFLMGFRFRNRGSILNNLQGILSWAFFNILEFWERSLSCKNSCTFGLLPLLKLLQNLSVTNSEHNSRLMFFSYKKHSLTPLPWERVTIILTICPPISCLWPLVLPAFLIQPFVVLSSHTIPWCLCLLA